MNLSVNSQSLRHALAFMRACPCELPLPDVLVDEHGFVNLDWDEASDRTLSVMVYPTGELGYAVVTPSESAHGRLPFTEDDHVLPTAILIFLQSIYLHHR